MQTVKFVYWQEGKAWIGYLQDYPDYWTQGKSFADLQEHLRDLYHDLTSWDREASDASHSSQAD
jgi:hypothetical protein